MADEKVNARIVLSRRVLQGWERAGSPGGRAEDTLRMIGEEVVVLQSIVREYPEKALSVGDLVKRYESLRDLIKTSTH